MGKLEIGDPKSINARDAGRADFERKEDEKASLEARTSYYEEHNDCPNCPDSAEWGDGPAGVPCEGMVFVKRDNDVFIFACEDDYKHTFKLNKKGEVVK